MTKSVRRILVASLVIGLILLGAFRDFVFVNINYQLIYLLKDQAFSKAHSFFDFLEGYDYWTIYYWKFIITGIFAVLYLFFTWSIVKVLFNNKSYQKYTVYLFGGVFVISLLLFGLGYLFGDGHFGYEIARQFMEVIQSPIAAMVLVPIFLLLDSGMLTTKEE